MKILPRGAMQFQYPSTMACRGGDRGLPDRGPLFYAIGGGGGGGTTPGAPELDSVKVVLTNSQILALPTTGAVLVPPTTPFDRLFVPVHVDLLMQSQGGAYANVATPAWLNLYWGTGNGLLLGSCVHFDPAVGYPSNPGVIRYDVSTLFSFSRRKAYVNIVANSTQIANADSGNLNDNALILALQNGSNGNLTGGNSANTLTAYVFYNELLF